MYRPPSWSEFSPHNLSERRSRGHSQPLHCGRTTSPDEGNAGKCVIRQAGREKIFWCVLIVNYYVIIIYYWQQRFLWFLTIKFSIWLQKMSLFFTFEIDVFRCGPSKWSVESGSIVFEVSWFDHLKFEGRSFLCGSLSRPGRAGHIKKRCLPSSRSKK